MIDLKKLFDGQIATIEEFAKSILRSHSYLKSSSVSELFETKTYKLGDRLNTGKTNWIISDSITPFPVNNNLYLKAIGDVYVEDFNDGILRQEDYVMLAHTYCQSIHTSNRLIFDPQIEYFFSAKSSFVIFVESGGWHCFGNCNLIWDDSPLKGYAIKVKGRYSYKTKYSEVVNNSNHAPLSGFTIGRYGEMKRGAALVLGFSDSISSMANAVVTSKFKIDRLSIYGFDDVIVFYPGVWACELTHVNTMNGSWKTPRYFKGLDFGESIKVTSCFIADNHKRGLDGDLGRVELNNGEFIFTGCSFNNIRVTIDGDASVKMNSPHFENPHSTAKNKRFLEVIGNHAFCVLDKPQIVIRDTWIFSTLFYCKSSSDGNPHPSSGGLVFISPSYQAPTKYRPDLARLKSTINNEFESDGYLELVGGGGRVYLEGGAHINSLFYSRHPVMIARNLVGASIQNHSFTLSNKDLSPCFWKTENQNASAKVIKIRGWVGDCALELSSYATLDSEVKIFQRLSCSSNQICVGSLKVKTSTGNKELKHWVFIVEINYLDWNSKHFSQATIRTIDLSEIGTQNENGGWLHIPILRVAPEGTASIELSFKLKSAPTIDENFGLHKVTKASVLIDTATLNIL
jgi:hypothetical protein